MCAGGGGGGGGGGKVHKLHVLLQYYDMISRYLEWERTILKLYVHENDISAGDHI